MSAVRITWCKIAAAPIEAWTKELGVLTHPDLRATARVKALMNLLVRALEQDKASLEGWR